MIFNFGDDEYRAERVDIPAEEVEGTTDEETVEAWVLLRRMERTSHASNLEIQLPRRGVYHDSLASAVMYALEDAGP